MRDAGPLTAKAALLQDGLQWWLRGRYGAGPEIMGLVKTQQAVRTPEGRLQLQMPEKLEAPDPFGKAPPTTLFPFYHRRHLHGHGARVLRFARGESFERVGCALFVRGGMHSQ